MIKVNFGRVQRVTKYEYYLFYLKKLWTSYTGCSWIDTWFSGEWEGCKLQKKCIYDANSCGSGEVFFKKYFYDYLSEN